MNEVSTTWRSRIVEDV